MQAERLFPRRLDNQTATLKVGDEVPIQTQTSQAVTKADAPLISSITMKETGIILKVTPRVNASGLVLLDIDQEDSDVVPTTTSTINSPTIRQRQINSSVAVQSGGEIVLGGIITRQTEHDQSGLPFLNSVPLIGKALATSGLDSDARTELLVILRPTILASQGEVAAVTQEIKRRMREAVRRNLPVLRLPVDVILHPRRSVIDLEFPALEREVAQVFRQVQKMAERQVPAATGDATAPTL